MGPTAILFTFGSGSEIETDQKFQFCVGKCWVSNYQYQKPPTQLSHMLVICVKGKKILQALKLGFRG
jgi:hypothetical protein